jgi:hypothetical protein
MQNTKRWIVGLAAIYSATTAYAGSMGVVAVEKEKTQSSYLSVYGGGGTLSSMPMAQLGTAFFPESSGGALAVNAFGHTKSSPAWLVGANLGHSWENQSAPLFSAWSLISATEVEGFYINANTIKGTEINNGTDRLIEHDFKLKYPTDAAVGLVNGVIYLNNPEKPQWRPYAGVGVGMALVSINKANSYQSDPAETGINHYNSDSSASSTTFATQGKIGLSFDWTDHIGLFAEYRYLYVGSTDFTFGSTVYPTHAVTNNWNAKLGSQSYNSGVAGIRFTI